MSLPAKKGWCPGALRPMATGDGLLLRIRPSAGRLSLDQMAALADLSQAFGSGVMEISSRANLQLRGLHERDLPSAWERLAALRLIDDDADVEAVRNILVSPLSDIDRDALLDVAPFVAALEARLRTDPVMRRLPPKHSIAIDAGGRFALSGRDAEVIFCAARVADVLGWKVFSRFDPEATFIALDRLPDAASTLARRFLNEKNPRQTQKPKLSDAGEQASDPVGVLKLGSYDVLVVAPPLGRMTAKALAALVETAKAEGAADCRVLPSRRLAFTGLDESSAAKLSREAAALGFIVDPDDPKLRVVACAGKPACASATAPVQSLALALAPSVPAGRGVALHVSGCVKGCARGAPTRLTLVARENGFDAIFYGRADGLPQTRLANLSAAQRFVAERLAPA